ncbi:MAG TPA: ATP-binding protein [Candidatus Acidoferrales bacterium]|nr:ATP-binding protein [Candidatus Acidoferrales bacterium]
MPQLIGRERQLRELREAYAASSDSRAARSLIVSGDEGSGKTTLTLALERAVSPEALVIRAEAYPLDRLLPFSLVHRLDRDLNATVERALRERPVVVIADDAANADEESLRQLAQLRESMADRPLLIVFTQTETGGDLALQALGPLDARALAAECYPDAPAAVLDAIVANAGGNPYEILVLAGVAARRNARGAEAVDSSSRSAVARELAALAPEHRTALQIASLLSEPSDALPPAPPLPGVPAHSLTALAISETIAMKIPLRRRIVAAMERHGVHGIREQMAFAEQVLASGDAEHARATLLHLAFAAAHEKLTRATVWAAERHLALGEPPDERFIDFYDAFFDELMENKAYADAEAVAAHALSEAQHRGVPGIGALAGRLISAQESAGRHDVARASRARYAQWLETNA